MKRTTMLELRALAPYMGPPGSRIPGSRLVRDYCRLCGWPMRINPDASLGSSYCSDCNNNPPPAHTALTQRQRIGCEKTDS